MHRLVKDRNTPQKVVWRAQIVLAVGDGMGSVAIAATVGKSVLTVRRWRRRYAKAGVEGLLKGATRPPGRKPLTPEMIKRVVDLTLHRRMLPIGASAPWQLRSGSRRRRCTRFGERMASGLPMKKGRAGTMTHDLYGDVDVKG